MTCLVPNENPKVINSSTRNCRPTTITLHHFKFSYCQTSTSLSTRLAHYYLPLGFPRLTTMLPLLLRHLHRRSRRVLLIHHRTLFSTTSTSDPSPLSFPLSYPTFLIWGSNTSLGKTLIPTGLAFSFRLSSPGTRKFLYLKPVQTAERENGVVEDAAVLEILKIELEAINKDKNGKLDSFCIIETAGSVASPGPSGTLQCDLYKPFRFPGVLVGDGRLGGISGIISAYESLKIRGYDIVAVVFEDHGLVNEVPLLSYLGNRWLQTELARDMGYAAGRFGHVMFPENVYELALECAELLLEGVAKGWASRTYFSDNGSTDIEIALKMVFRKYFVDNRSF
ncbi:adenosylmethionine-8-amino-7-oxononanoate aminotransferase, putative [Ricinus communis]|uniref:Adenosylmethionine-8-amino-7-oxononanoate aminotransferase, putative n=1 Tax=Ricinus communis TaxID=3988 RepID=B9SZR0_RICCO|nr:adenosylmethionine-8-amino-7-oxononanoate aminotransferase, putative [Ricinus communis]